MIYEIEFLKALALTITIETAVLFLLFKVIFKKIEISNVHLLLTGIFTTFATLPYLWFIFPYFIHSKIWYHVLGEMFVTVVESIIIMAMLRIKYSMALLVSFICNAMSYGIGLLIHL